MHERNLAAFLTWAAGLPAGRTGEVASAPRISAPALSATARGLLRQRRIEAPSPAALGIATEEALSLARGGATTDGTAREGLTWHTCRVGVGDNKTIKLLWARDGEGDAVWGKAERLEAAGTVSISLTTTTLADGGEKLGFEAPDHGWEGVPTLRSTWTRLIAANGNVLGAGVFSLVSPEGAVRTLPVAFGGTTARWTATLRDPGARDPVAVSITQRADGEP
jgi:hypothetical protein